LPLELEDQGLRTPEEHYWGEEGERVFERMLWLTPSGNQGMRFPIAEVRAKAAGEDRREER